MTFQSGDTCDTSMVFNSSCANGVCYSNTTFGMSSTCPSTDINVSVSATNILGEGPLSDLVTISEFKELRIIVALSVILIDLCLLWNYRW